MSSQQTKNDDSVGPLIVYDSEIDEFSQTACQKTEDDDVDHLWTTDRRSKKTVRQQLAWQGTVVLTRDYYQWLQHTFGKDRFRLECLHFVLFYKTEPVLNTVYRDLVNLRASTDDSVLKTFLKRLVNLSAGFFGSRSSQFNSKTSYRLVNKLPRNYAFYRHSADLRFTVDLEEASYFLLETKPWPVLGRKRSPSKSAVPLFLAIVEYGKLRLVDIFLFLQQHLVPGSFRLLYSNVDNMILALSAPTLEEAVAEDRRDSVRALAPHFFTATTPGDDLEGVLSSIKIPGHAELKWMVQQDWKFITLRTQHYCLASTRQDIHKVSGLSCLSSQEAFAYAERILEGQRVAIPQERRVRKMVGVDTKPVVFYY